MSRHFKLVIPVLVLGWGILLSSPGTAQYGISKKQQAQQMQAFQQAFSIKGTVDEISAGGIIKVSADKGETWLIQIRPQSKVSVTGTTEAAILRTGLCVRFRGQFDNRYKSTGQIKELEVFNPRAGFLMGAAPDQGGDWDKPISNPFAAMESKSPIRRQTRRPPPDRNATKGGPAPNAAPAPTDNNANANGTALRVAGKITQVKDNSLVVAVGNVKFFLEIAPDAEVKLNISDLSRAANGDQIEVTGIALRDGAGVAHDVHIKLAAPLDAHGNRKQVADAKAADKLATKAGDKTASKTGAKPGAAAAPGAAAPSAAAGAAGVAGATQNTVKTAK